MTIHATVDCGAFQITSFWDVLERKQQKFLIFSELNEGKFVGLLPLEQSHIRELGTHGPDKSYVGTLKSPDAKRL